MHPTDSDISIANDFLVAIENWLMNLAVQNYSPHTLSAYRKNIYQFAYFLTAQNQSWQTCEQRHIGLFLSERFDKDKIQNVSGKQALSAIRQFYKYAIAQKLTNHNPTIGQRLKAPPRPLPKIAEEDLLKILLEQPTPDDPANARLWLRDRAMFELAYGSGLRLSELVGLDVADVDLVAKMVRVLGKGQKTRVVPMTSKSVKALQIYLPHRELWQEGTDALFISERHGARLTGRAVQLRLKICAERVGIEHNFYPHLLRHCFASHILSSSGDLRAVQEMLGHESVATTQIYTQVDFGALTKIYDKAHPRAVAHVIDVSGEN